MFYRALLFALFAVFACVVFSQLNGKAYNYKQLYNDAEKLYTSESVTPATDSAALLKYQAVIKQLITMRANDSLLFDSYIKCGFLLSSFKKDSLATRQFLAAVKINNATASLHDSLSFVPWLFAGSSYYNTYNPDSALYCYKQAEQLLQLYPHLSEAERLYNKTGVLYYEAGDYKRSVYYFSKALSMLDTLQPGNAFFIVNYKNNIASAWRKLQLYNQALHIYTALLPYGFYHNELLHNIGVTYLDKGDAVTAITYLKQANYKSATRYNDLARAYLLLQDTGNAMANVRLALNVYNTKVLQQGPDYANTLKLYGDVAMLKKQPRNALIYYHKAILASAPGFTDTLPSANPVVFNSLNHFYFLFSTIAAKAGAYLALQGNGQTNGLANAFNAYKSALALSAYMEKTYGTDDSKLFLKKNVEKVYKAAIETGLELYQHTKDEKLLQQVFAYVEGSKASVLQINVTDAALGNIKGMPVQLLAEEKSLKARLNNADLQLTQATGVEQVTALQQQLQEAAIRLAHVQQQLNDNTNYSRLKYAASALPLKNIQQNVLNTNSAILSYYLTGSSLVCFYITGNQVGYVKEKTDGTLTANIAALSTQLHLGEGADNKIFAYTAGALYKQLIAPVADKLTGITRLIIIPHNELSYVPFEVLSSSSGSLLLQQYAVSYQYSCNFLSTGSAAISRYNVLSVAPFAAGGTGGLPVLPASNTEVEGLPGKALMNAAATSAAFLNNATAYPVLHLATHAQANDTLPLNSYIQFYGGENARLYEPDIYQLNLTNTRLAILSACETGSGQLVNSEGLISLSRAFAYAGCKSVVTSLWKADDAATAFICNHLHKYLQAGYAIDEALQKAKMDYLQSSNVEQRYKKPAYWANLVLIGDTHAVATKTHHWLFAVAGLILLIAGAVWFLKNKKATA